MTATNAHVAEATATTEAEMRPQSVPVNVYEATEALVLVAPMPAVTPRGRVRRAAPGRSRRRCAFWAHVRSAAPRDYLAARVGVRRLRAPARAARRLRRRRRGDAAATASSSCASCAASAPRPCASARPERIRVFAASECFGRCPPRALGWQPNTRMGSAEVGAAGVDVGRVGDDVDDVGDAAGEGPVERRADLARGR